MLYGDESTGSRHVTSKTSASDDHRQADNFSLDRINHSSLYKSFPVQMHNVLGHNGTFLTYVFKHHTDSDTHKDFRLHTLFQIKDSGFQHLGRLCMALEIVNNVIS